MDSLQIAFIMEQAYKCPEDYISANAQVVLYLLYGMEVPECEEMVNRSQKLLVKDVEFTLPETGAFILDNFPDPFVNQTYINYYLPEGIKGSLVVIDVNGKTIETFMLNEGENTLEISTTNWEPGVYTFGFYLNGNPIEFKKMVKTQ